MTETIQVSTFEVLKDDWAKTRIAHEETSLDLEDGELLFRVGRLALTANNISYASTGDSLGYWGFFPAEAGWGRIPAMGWGEVIASNCAEVCEGERAWGWFPYSTHLKIRGGKVRRGSFTDTSEHRAKYAPVYAQFDRAAANPLYDPAREDHDSLLRGLFTTAWLVEDFIAVNDQFGAVDCLVTSASSKTSIALAHSLGKRGALCAIGITSARNREFCESLGCYDRIVLYDDAETLDADRAAVLVDMAGNVSVLRTLHRHYGDRLKHSARIGFTHSSEGGDLKDLPGPEARFFFAPTHIAARAEELGRKPFMVRLGGAYAEFREYADTWLRIEHSHGAAALEATYRSVLAGSADPATGQVVSL